jgi:hypothetical protein
MQLHWKTIYEVSLVPNAWQTSDELDGQKHSLGLESYLQEEQATNPNANPELLALADRVREIRRRIQELNNMKHTSEQQKLQSTV